MDMECVQTVFDLDKEKLDSPERRVSTYLSITACEEPEPRDPARAVWGSVRDLRRKNRIISVVVLVEDDSI
jgi:hypothetical protein